LMCDGSNWRGKPLVSYQVIVHLIDATTTKTSLKVRSELDPTTYPLVSRFRRRTRKHQHCPT